MRTVANMIPAMVEDKCGLSGAVSIFSLANGYNRCEIADSEAKSIPYGARPMQPANMSSEYKG